MVNSKIVNNKPICGKCDSDYISGIRDHKEIEMSGNKYVLFKFRCYSCNNDNQYLADIDLERTIRYEIDSKIKDVEEV